MKITKSQLKQIIKEELNEIGYYGLGSEPFGAERYRKKIKGFEEMLDKMSHRDQECHNCKTQSNYPSQKYSQISKMKK